MKHETAGELAHMANEDAISSAAAAGRDGLVNQMRELEAFIAKAGANGDELPPEALEMIQRLREIVLALDQLTASLKPE